MLRFFYREKRIAGPVVDLVEEKVVKGSAFNNWIPSIYYGIYLHNTHIKVGRCDLRIGDNEELYYAGNIGYHVFEKYRGNHYAYEACRLLFDVAKKEHQIEKLIITCSPENTPSKKTLLRLNGKLLETTVVPSSHWLYQRGETVKEIYEYLLN
ncbi:MAG: GNAT family N-acetyltransferase [Solobacterium sp.]|nr:GNAT family N-acetyltransferase [Solobacterium sp.]